jgi:hypothetical protein
MKKKQLTKILRNIPPKKIEKFRWKLAYKEALLGILTLYIPFYTNSQDNLSPPPPIIRDESQEYLIKHMDKIHNQERDYTS